MHLVFICASLFLQGPVISDRNGYNLPSGGFPIDDFGIGGTFDAIYSPDSSSQGEESSRNTS